MDSLRQQHLQNYILQCQSDSKLFFSDMMCFSAGHRLRAGLCDRCTVTQEVAKRKQHEFEASQMQSFQHISLLGILSLYNKR